jgi:hypothetical protein
MKTINELINADVLKEEIIVARLDMQNYGESLWQITNIVDSHHGVYQAQIFLSYTNTNDYVSADFIESPYLLDHTIERMNKYTEELNKLLHDFLLPEESICIDWNENTNDIGINLYNERIEP